MTVKELSQLYYLNREIEMDQERLQRVEEELAELEDEEEEIISPSSPSFTGMPRGSSGANKLERAAEDLWELHRDVQKKKALLEEITATIRRKQAQYLEEQAKLERYIATLPNSLLRMIFTYRFINGLPWAQVSECIGMDTTEDSVKKRCYNFLKGKTDA